MIPAYVLARGEKALSAYNRALENGRTYDKRVKVLLVGQDRVGKTSLSKYLRGEPFDESEPSTEGVTMIAPVMDAGTDAWRNPVHLEDTTVFDYKMTAKITEYLSSKLSELSMESPMETDGAEDQDPMARVGRQDGKSICFNPVIIKCHRLSLIVDLFATQIYFPISPTVLTTCRNRTLPLPD